MNVVCTVPSPIAILNYIVSCYGRRWWHQDSMLSRIQCSASTGIQQKRERRNLPFPLQSSRYLEKTLLQMAEKLVFRQLWGLRAGDKGKRRRRDSSFAMLALQRKCGAEFWALLHYWLIILETGWRVLEILCSSLDWTIKGFPLDTRKSRILLMFP